MVHTCDVHVSMRCHVDCRELASFKATRSKVFIAVMLRGLISRNVDNWVNLYNDPMKASRSVAM
jgi:hypothetical protein